VGRPEVNRPLGRSRTRWEDNIKMDMAQERDKCRAVVHAVRNFWVPLKAGNFLTSLEPVNFTGRNLYITVSSHSRRSFLPVGTSLFNCMSLKEFDVIFKPLYITP
jgi:hypothetical protein